MPAKSTAVVRILALLLLAIGVSCCPVAAATPMPAATMNMQSTPAPAARSNQDLLKIAETPDSGPASPSTGTEWSIFNHRGAGFFVLLWGLGALIVGLQWPRRTWFRFVPPLALVGLAEFLIIRNDPKAWPTGPIGFWVSFQDPAVLQHRIYVLLILAIAAVELLRAADRLPKPWQMFALPGLAVFGAVFLFFHKHGGLAAQHMMQQMSDPAMAGSPAVQAMATTMKVIRGEHFWFSISGFGLAAAKLLADGGVLRGRLGATLWTVFAIALGVYMLGYTE